MGNTQSSSWPSWPCFTFLIPSSSSYSPYPSIDCGYQAISTDADAACQSIPAHSRVVTDGRGERVEESRNSIDWSCGGKENRTMKNLRDGW